MTDVIDPMVWNTVARTLAKYRADGLTGVMTEDTVRFATAQALVASGIGGSELRVERPHTAIQGARIDLVLGDPFRVLIEFKFPREPNEKNAPWTMLLGEVLKDFYRLATYPGEVKRLFVYAESLRLRRYMMGAADKLGVDLDRPVVTLEPSAIQALPSTALGIIGTHATMRITARRIHLTEVDDTLRLAVYDVDPTADPRIEQRPALVEEQADSNAEPVLIRPPRHSRARIEILGAIDDLMRRSGVNVVSLEEIVHEMRRRNSSYAESTVRTMVASHMCANAPDNNATTWDDLERVGRGVYRRL